MRSARNTLSLGAICSLAHSISVAVSSESRTFLNRLTTSQIGRRLYRQRRDSVQDPAAGPLLAITAVTLLAAALAAALVIAGKPA